MMEITIAKTKTQLQPDKLLKVKLHCWGSFCTGKCSEVGQVTTLEITV